MPFRGQSRKSARNTASISTMPRNLREWSEKRTRENLQESLECLFEVSRESQQEAQRRFRLHIVMPKNSRERKLAILEEASEVGVIRIMEKPTEGVTDFSNNERDASSSRARVFLSLAAMICLSRDGSSATLSSVGT